MNQLILYYQPECHLCDQAENLLHLAGLSENYRKVDIETDSALLKRYEIHVPVLKRSDNREELFWPFDLADIKAFLDTQR